MSICGNCGISAAPVALQTFEDLKKYCRPVLPFDSFDREWQTWTEFGKYLAAVEKRHSVFQSRALVGHGTLRIAVMGMADRTPQAYELQKMKDLLEQSMQQGALGLSSGLITDARKNGVKVLCDQYQSNKGSTTLAQLISPEFQADGIKGLLAHLKNPHSRQKIIECLKNDVPMKIICIIWDLSR